MYEIQIFSQVDLKLKEIDSEIYYYKDHLMAPILVVKLQVEDKVTVHLDVNHLHRITENYFGHWEAEMERV